MQRNIILLLILLVINTYNFINWSAYIQNSAYVINVKFNEFWQTEPTCVTSIPLEK